MGFFLSSLLVSVEDMFSFIMRVLFMFFKGLFFIISVLVFSGFLISIFFDSIPFTLLVSILVSTFDISILTEYVLSHSALLVDDSVNSVDSVDSVDIMYVPVLTYELLIGNSSLIV